METAAADNVSSTSLAWGAFAAGVLMGACAGLLFAPQAGAETRRQIKGYAERQADQVRTAGQRAKEWVHEVSRTATKAPETKHRSAYGAEAAVREPEFAGHGVNGR